MREVLSLSPYQAMCLSSPVTFGGQCGSMLVLRAAKGLVLLILAWFQVNLGANLIEQGEIVMGRPCGLVAQ